jgi:hypothetical protein
VCHCAREKVAAAAVGMTSRDDGSARGCNGEGFTFHARSFIGVETTLRFGSSNPDAVEFMAFDLRRRRGTAVGQEETA